MFMNISLYVVIHVCDKWPSSPYIIGIFHQILNSFSMIRNIKSIMSTDVGKSDLTYLHGIRVLSLFWIILFHVNVSTINSLWPYGKLIMKNKYIFWSLLECACPVFHDSLPHYLSEDLEKLGIKRALRITLRLFHYGRFARAGEAISFGHEQ
jgi:energy-coupling factor transporter transmembrane protein EcfT